MTLRSSRRHKRASRTCGALVAARIGGGSARTLGRSEDDCNA